MPKLAHQGLFNLIYNSYLPVPDWKALEDIFNKIVETALEAEFISLKMLSIAYVANITCVLYCNRGTFAQASLSDVTSATICGLLCKNPIPKKSQVYLGLEIKFQCM